MGYILKFQEIHGSSWEDVCSQCLLALSNLCKLSRPRQARTFFKPWSPVTWWLKPGTGSFSWGHSQVADHCGETAAWQYQAVAVTAGLIHLGIHWGSTLSPFSATWPAPPRPPGVCSLARLQKNHWIQVVVPLQHQGYGIKAARGSWSAALRRTTCR